MVIETIIDNIGVHNLPVDSFQPSMRRVRKYKNRPACFEVMFGRRCGFQMTTAHVDDVETWVHELSEHTTAVMLQAITGREGLNFRITHKWQEGMYMEPTIPHLLSSLITHSGVWSTEGFRIVQPEEYESRVWPNMNDVTFEMDTVQELLDVFL